MLKRNSISGLGMCAMVLSVVCVFGSAVEAGPLKFPMSGKPHNIGFAGNGGSFSYTDGGSLDINGDLTQVIRLPQGNIFGIASGEVSIKTGACDAGCSKANGNDILQLGFGNGTITITGEIPSMGINTPTTLLTGTLTNIGATLDGNNTKPGTGAGGPDKGGLTATIMLNMINATLLKDLGFAANDTFGVGDKKKNAGTGITFLLSLGISDFTNFLSGGTKTGSVFNSRITLDPDAAPEPSPYLLFGSSLLVGAWILRRKLAAKS
jgi:hypothetical protein